MTYLALSPLRRAVALVAVTGVAVVAPSAVAAPASKSKAAKRSASADLIVRDLEVEFLGETLDISATVANKGGKKARRNDVVVVLSGDQTLSDDDDVLDETEIRKVKPGKTRAVETEVDVPADEDLPSGDVYLLVCADAGNVVAEKDESNNCASELIASDEDLSYGDDEEAEDESSEEAAVVEETEEG